MSASLVAALVWALVANILGLLPSRDNHWRRAWFLIATGLPVLVWVVVDQGVVAGLIVLAGGASILRWPLRYLLRWLHRRLAPPRR